jgi:hypothetical protein
MSRDHLRALEADRGCRARFSGDALLSVCIRAVVPSSVRLAVNSAVSDLEKLLLSSEKDVHMAWVDHTSSVLRHPINLFFIPG